MTDAELKQQPKTVREEFSNITDREVDGDYKLSAMRKELETLQANLLAAQARHDRVREVKKMMPSDIAGIEQEIEEIAAQRSGAIASAMIDSDTPDFSNDDALLEKLLGLKLKLERLHLASGVLDAQERIAYRAVELASNPCAALEERISQRRDALKLTEARRRHGYA